MANSNGSAAAVGGCIGLTLLAVAVVVAVMLLGSVGSVFGAGIAVRNYFLAFRHNVEPERAAS